jgi:hypothetical protein
MVVTKIMAGAAAVALLLGACGGDDSSGSDDVELDLEDVQAFIEDAAEAGPCEEVFAPGVTVTLDGMSQTCIDAEGAARIFGTASLDCTDGTVLAWNDLGWAILEDDSGPLVLHEPGGDQTPPDDAYAACQAEPVELTPCEQAWEDGLGNAGQPGTERESWLEDCRAEGGDETLGG